MLGVKTIRPVLNRSGQPISGAAEKGSGMLNNSSGALSATISASM
jgi:hypothetical protein